MSGLRSLGRGAQRGLLPGDICDAAWIWPEASSILVGRSGMLEREDLALCPRPAGTQWKPPLPRRAANCDFQADKRRLDCSPSMFICLFIFEVYKKMERKSKGPRAK